MSEIEKQAENLYQEIANAKIGTIPAEVVTEWKKLGELLYRQSRPTPRAAGICPRCEGTGSYADYIGKRACSLCGGTGKCR